jgi:prepilin-type N-terminal cleavage/methylation domain-containing protein
VTRAASPAGVRASRFRAAGVRASRFRAAGVRPSRPRRAGDAGVTLIEVMISMTIMSIAMAMFTTGILQMYRSANKNEAMSTAQSQISIAFQRLDKEIRYAAGLSTQGFVGADPYVEFLITNGGSPVCTELRLHVATAQLQRRTWTQGSTPVTPSGWLPLASNISSTQPFTVSAADATYNFQRLTLNLVAGWGSGTTATSKRTDITFTALNTSLETASTTICTEGRPIP